MITKVILISLHSYHPLYCCLQCLSLHLPWNTISWQFSLSCEIVRMSFSGVESRFIYLLYGSVQLLQWLFELSESNICIIYISVNSCFSCVSICVYANSMWADTFIYKLLSLNFLLMIIISFNFLNKIQKMLIKCSFLPTYFSILPYFEHLFSYLPSDRHLAQIFYVAITKKTYYRLLSPHF